MRLRLLFNNGNTRMSVAQTISQNIARCRPKIGLCLLLCLIRVYTDRKVTFVLYQTFLNSNKLEEEGF